MAQTCTIKMAEDLSVQSHSYLFMLYKPLMGMQACTLYEILCACDGKKVVPEDLKDFTGLTDSQLEAARVKLEQFMLLSTYQSEDQKDWIYRVYPPQSPRKFLTHEVFSRLFMNNISAGRYERLVELYDLKDEIPASYTNVSASMNPAELENSWTEKKETLLQHYIPSGSDLKRYPFDWQLFFRGMERSIPYRLRTRDNMARIAYLSHMYGLNEEDMRRYVVRGIPSDRNEINFDLVVQYLDTSTKTGSRSKTHQNLPESPAEHLQKTLPEGVYLLDAERKTLADLSLKYGFPDEVINYMIDVALEACNQKFNERYIKKMAAAWHRAKINTLEKAREYTKPAPNRTQPQTASLPDWYYKEDPGKADADTIAELEALLKG